MKRQTKFALLFSLAYFISYITRINFGAVISEMVSATGFSKDLLSLSVTGSFVTYGVGQLISGVLGDKISPKNLVLYGLIITVLMNMAIPFCTSPYTMMAVWCVNGFAQSLMWPPIVKLMTLMFSNEVYKKVCEKVILASSFATIMVYLVSPVLIAISGWKTVFFFSAILGLIMILVWQKYCLNLKPKRVERNTTSKSNISVFFCPAMLCVMIAIICVGMLRDGITTWMPTYISETYNLKNEISILTGVLLPLFSVFSINMATKLYTKKLKNPVFCGGVMFLAGAFSAVLMVVTTGKNAIFSVVSAALITGCMHGVNLMLICMIPAFFKKFDFVSTGSGVINFCTYIGSAISTYGIAILSQKSGWGFTLKLWVLIAVLGTLLCFIASKPWKKQFM